MILERHPDILEIEADQGLPRYLKVAMKNLAAMRYGKANNAANKLTVPAPQVLISLVGLRYGFQLVMRVCRELDHGEVVETIMNRSRAPQKAQQMDQELDLVDHLPDYLQSYLDSVQFGPNVDESVQRSVGFGMQFAIWNLRLFEAYEVMKDLLEEEHPELGYRGTRRLYLDLDANQDLTATVQLNEPA